MATAAEVAQWASEQWKLRALHGSVRCVPGSSDGRWAASAACPAPPGTSAETPPAPAAAAPWAPGAAWGPASATSARSLSRLECGLSFVLFWGGVLFSGSGSGSVCFCLVLLNRSGGLQKTTSVLFLPYPRFGKLPDEADPLKGFSVPFPSCSRTSKK